MASDFSASETSSVDGGASVSDPLLAGLRSGDRRALAKAITLIESTREDHRERAETLLAQALPYTGASLRLGISGVPGVGKSTFIEALGLMLVAQGHRVAVLAIDPSSRIRGGSILGDKTRMEQLASHPATFIRPSPSLGTLGGVAARTREAVLLVEAAGFDVVMVETVGVGQSETAVADLTDLFILLQLPNAGDDLQAMKRGVMEWADIIVINKSDLDPEAAALAQSQVAMAQMSTHLGQSPDVLRLSALRGEGLPAFWDRVQFHATTRRAEGRFDRRRQEQSRAWMWDLVKARLMAKFLSHPAVHEALQPLETAVLEGSMTPNAAVKRLLHLFEQAPSSTH